MASHDENKMPDIRIRAGRSLLWDDPQRDIGYRAMVIRMLQQMADDETETPEDRNEAERIMEKLYAHGKRCKSPSGPP